MNITTPSICEYLNKIESIFDNLLDSSIDNTTRLSRFPDANRTLKTLKDALLKSRQIVGDASVQAELDYVIKIINDNLIEFKKKYLDIHNLNATPVNSGNVGQTTGNVYIEEDCYIDKNIIESLSTENNAHMITSSNEQFQNNDSSRLWESSLTKINNSFNTGVLPIVEESSSKNAQNTEQKKNKSREISNEPQSSLISSTVSKSNIGYYIVVQGGAPIYVQDELQLKMEIVKQIRKHKLSDIHVFKGKMINIDLNIMLN